MPNKILAMAAERWLFQETSDKLVVFDSHYIFLLERASSVYSSGYSSASRFLPVRHVSVQPSALGFSANWVTSRRRSLYGLEAAYILQTLQWRSDEDKKDPKISTTLACKLPLFWEEIVLKHCALRSTPSCCCICYVRKSKQADVSCLSGVSHLCLTRLVKIFL